MSDADDSLDLLVRIKSDTAGAGEAKDALAGVTKETKKSGEANEEHGKSFLHAESSARGFHRLLHSITEESPLMGSALRLAISPVGGAFMAAAVALQAFKKASEEAEKAAAESAEKNAQPLADMKDAADKAADAAYTLITAYTEWAKHGHDVADAIQAQNEQLTTNIERIYADKTAVEAGAKAHKEAALALLEADRATGRISEGGYQVAKQRIEDQAKEKSHEAEKKAVEEEIKLREAVTAAAAKADKEAAADAIKKQAAAKAGAAGGQHQAALESQAEIARAKADEAKKKLPAASEATAAAQEDVNILGWRRVLLDVATLFGLLGMSGKQRAQQELSYAEGQQSKLFKEQHQESEFAKRSADEAKRMERAQAARVKAAETANANADKRREDHQKEEEGLAKARAKLLALNQVTAATQGPEAFTSAIKTPVGKMAAEDVTAAEATAKALSEGKQVSKESQAQLVEIASAIEGHRATLQEAVSTMNQARQNFGSFSADTLKVVTQLTRIMEAHGSELLLLQRRYQILASQAMTMRDSTPGAG